MIFTCKGHNQPGIVLYGTMLALRYPVSKKDARVQQRVSFPMFILALKKLVMKMESQLAAEVDQAARNVNEYIRYMHRMCGFQIDDSFNPVAFSSDAMNGTLRIPPIARPVHKDTMGVNKQPDIEAKPEFVHFGLRHIVAGDFDFRFEVDVADHKPHIEAAIMMNWVCLDYSMSSQDVTIENQTLSLGMWIAAKLYECRGDVAGKLATIDEALDMR